VTIALATPVAVAASKIKERLRPLFL